MKTCIVLLSSLAFFAMIESCSINKNIQHTVRMVDAKSYMDHPPSAGIYYYK